jgi:hypothetical protein
VALTKTGLKKAGIGFWTRLDHVPPTTWYAWLTAPVHLLTGVAGLFVAHGLDSRPLLSFEVNGPHDLVHLVTGLFGLWAIANGRARTYTQTMTFTFALFSVAGFLDQPLFGLVTLAGPDMFLHGMLALLGEVALRSDEARAAARNARADAAEPPRTASPDEKHRR